MAKAGDLGILVGVGFEDVEHAIDVSFDRAQPDSQAIIAEVKIVGRAAVPPYSGMTNQIVCSLHWPAFDVLTPGNKYRRRVVFPRTSERLE